MICAGIDAGSRLIKAVLMDSDTGGVVASGTVDQAVDQEKLALGLFEKLLAENELTRDDVDRVVATGYGRHSLSFADRAVTEITCHARGVRHLVPDAVTIIEIGGQDSKFIRLDGRGTVEDFAMNDRCAAGTGRFLEVVAARLGMDLETLGETAGKSTHPATISSMCVVFAETEIIGLLSAGVPPEDIVAGVETSVVTRVSSMAARAVEPPIVFTGGVAMIPGMAKTLQSALGHPVTVAPDPFMTGALGAALIASGD